jgi:RNA polymerase sigma-70 factor (ECF subfamily)
VLSEQLVHRLYREANAERWDLPAAVFAAALETCARNSPASERDVERYLSSLHLEDLALACACADGRDAAWEYFMSEYRPQLYRAADALDPSGGARELADSLYAQLYGLRADMGVRRTLFRYFHGRSSLATWLRAVLSQRYVDQIRSARRLEPLPDEDVTPGAAPAAPPDDPERSRCVDVIQKALGHALAQLSSRDRLRLGCYYAQGLTLAETGRLLREHEATVSRQLARTRKTLKEQIEQYLRNAGLQDEELARCFQSIAEDAGPLDLPELLSDSPQRKISAPHRSIRGESL